MRGSLFQITTFIERTATQAQKVELLLQLEKSPLVSVKVMGLQPIGNNEVLLAAVYKSSGRAWSDADIIALLSFRRKFVLAGD
jgi:hypothetical protein